MFVFNEPVALRVYFFSSNFRAFSIGEYKLIPFCRYAGASYYGSPFTAYTSPFADDVSAHGFEPYPSYHDPALHAAIPSYAYDHDHHHPHHIPDYGHYVPGHAPHPQVGMQAMPGMPAMHGMMSDEDDSKDSEMGGSESAQSTYRRVGKHRRRRANRQQSFE